MRVPGPVELSAAWAGLHPAARDQIGLVVLDMILQEFIHGDACVVGEQPEDRPFPDETDEHEQIRALAAEASNRRLNELTPLIHGLFPDLFGQPGENPMWCANPGPGPSAAAPIRRGSGDEAEITVLLDSKLPPIRTATEARA